VSRVSWIAQKVLGTPGYPDNLDTQQMQLG